jgi:CRISPR-associated protein Cas1
VADGNTQFESDDEWAQRCIFWREHFDGSQTRRKRRERRKEPLILSGYGLSIRIDRGRLIISEGTTHYPSKRIEHAFFKGSLDLPPRIVIVDGAGSITLDAIDWLTEQDISLVRIRYDGKVATAMSPNGFAADPSKVAWQLATRNDPIRQLEFAIETTTGKLKASIETLSEYWVPSKVRDVAIDVAQETLKFIASGDADTLSKLLGQEGKAAAAYWRAWQSIEMKWKASKRHPIPDSWQKYMSRSSAITGVKAKNWKADHPNNAMLNYAYAVLLTEVRIQAIAEGYDPNMGILHDQRHKDKEQTPSFALDRMEPMRPVADRAVLRLIEEHMFSGADFDLQYNGVVRLNPQLARRLVGSVAKFSVS